jgi:hypothetical protein
MLLFSSFPVTGSPILKAEKRRKAVAAARAAKYM